MQSIYFTSSQTKLHLPKANFTSAKQLLHLPKASFTSAKQILHSGFAVGRLRMSAFGTHRGRFASSCRIHSATEPPGLQFQQWVGCFTPSVKIDKRFRQLPQGGSQADDTFSLGLFLASLYEGGIFALAKSEGSTPHSQLLTPNFATLLTLLRSSLYYAIFANRCIKHLNSYN